MYNFTNNRTLGVSNFTVGVSNFTNNRTVKCSILQY